MTRGWSPAEIIEDELTMAQLPPPPALDLPRYEVDRVTRRIVERLVQAGHLESAPNSARPVSNVERIGP